MEKVVVTGLGVLSPLGLTAEESWRNALEGVSGVAPITLFDSSDWAVKVAAEVKGFDPARLLDPRSARRYSRFEQFGLVAAREAITQAGLEVTEANAGRIGAIISSAVGGIEAIQNAIYILKDKGARRVSPFAIPMMMANGASGLVAIEYGLRGPSFSVTSACASGADGLGAAWSLIRSGVLDAALAGASESTICEIGIGAFDRLGAMTHRTDGVPQPFDADRDGLVMGEGAAVLVLESESHARARGAEILAELAGYAATADAYHITAPDENGSGGAAAIRAALEAAGVNPDQVDYVNAHGTATPLNDSTETTALKAALGEHAYRTPVSSTKSMTGHMMGATGALEAAFCVQAIRDGRIPPTINYHTPDPACDLDYVPNQARDHRVEVAISNSFGFGGHNAVLVFRRYTG